MDAIALRGNTFGTPADLWRFRLSFFSDRAAALRATRRGVLGTLAGSLGSIVLIATQPHAPWAIALAIVAALAYTFVARDLPDYIDSAAAGAALCVPIWIAFDIIALPLGTGEPLQWTAAGMHAALPQLGGWVSFGFAFGIILQALQRAARARLGPEPVPARAVAPALRRIVIVGGGFAGMTTAKSLERELRGDRSVDVTLVSATNALLFTPMLAEVAGGSIEPSHISSPARTALHRTTFVRAAVSAVDFERRVVRADDRDIAYDQLVLAVGAVSNYLGLDGVERWSLDFKTLLDAVTVRNHVIEMFERADREQDPALRRKRLTFVIAGGGFAGAELAGAVNDLARGILTDYPNLAGDELRVIVVHSGKRIVPELSATLAAYALERMTARGVTFRLGVRVASAARGVVRLTDGHDIETESLIWTAGTTPNPLLGALGVARDRRGAVVVDETLAVAGKPGVWALGDCAAVTDAKTKLPCPPTAQFALREAETVARNIRATLRDRTPHGFHFDSLGALCVVGYQTACAELALPFGRGRSVRFSGLFAWILWRGIYLAKLPGIERKVRVLIDWTVELFFPRDIVQTIDLQS